MVGEGDVEAVVEAALDTGAALNMYDTSVSNEATLGKEIESVSRPVQIFEGGPSVMQLDDDDNNRCGDLIVFGNLISEHLEFVEEIEKIELPSSNPHLDEPSVAEGALEKEKKLEKNEKTLKNVVNEIVQTEKRYLDRLNAVIDVYIKPFRENKIISEEAIRLQFSTWENIAMVHDVMYNNMVDDDARGELNIGKTFIHHTKYLKVYTEYLVNYDRAQKERSALMTKCKKFAEFLENAKNDVRGCGFEIEHLLIEPVQRIPRYRLLLQQVLKYTDGEKHPEQYSNVEIALKLISELAQISNEAIKRSESRLKMIEIMSTIEFRSRINFLEDSERVFLLEGMLMRQCRRKNKEFKFWLFSDMLIYGESLVATMVLEEIGSLIGKYRINRTFPLDQCRIIPTSYDSCVNSELAFIIESPKKSFIVWGKTYDEKIKWQQAFCDAQQKLLKKRTIENSDANIQIAPIWAPDKKTEFCSLIYCRKPFSLFSRRHHCRNCGLVVCDRCSKMRFRLPHVNDIEDVRVCDVCYKTLAPRDSLMDSAVTVDRISFSPKDGSSGPSEELSQKPKRRVSLLETISQTSERVSMAISSVKEELGEMISSNNTTPPPHPLHTSPDSVVNSSTSSTSSRFRRFSLTPSLGLDRLSLGILTSGKCPSSGELGNELDGEIDLLGLEQDRGDGDTDGGYMDDLRDLKAAPPKPPKPPKKDALVLLLAPLSEIIEGHDSHSISIELGHADEGDGQKIVSAEKS